LRGNFVKMELKEGTLVKSKAGRDKGKYMVAVSFDESHAYVCDGKERPLERPKKKNLRHLQITNKLIDKEKMANNRSLKKALAALTDAQL